MYIDKWANDAFPSKPVVSPATFGIVLIVLMYVLPDGIVGGGRRLGWPVVHSDLAAAAGVARAAL